jgi:hypothetical protein
VVSTHRHHGELKTLATATLFGFQLPARQQKRLCPLPSNPSCQNRCCDYQDRGGCVQSHRLFPNLHPASYPSCRSSCARAWTGARIISALATPVRWRLLCALFSTRSLPWCA